MCDKGVSGQIEAIWKAITRLEGQLSKIQSSLDYLSYSEVPEIKTDIWEMKRKADEVERGLQNVERLCR